MQTKTKKRSLKKEVLMIVGIILASIIVILGVTLLIQTGFGGKYQDKDGKYKHITKSTSLGHIANHPMFDGRGKQYFDLNEEFFNMVKWMNIRSIGHWLKWRPDELVDSLNYMIDKANEEKVKVLNVYSQDEITQDPTKAITSMVFIQGNLGAPYAIVIPGGAFLSVAMPQEGYTYAKRINEAGYNVFILRYRVGTNTQEEINNGRSVEDLSKAISYINAHRAELGVSQDDYSLWGSSAGGTIINAYCSNNSDYNFEKSGHYAPAAALMAYPAVGGAIYDGGESFLSDFPPAFIRIGTNDGLLSTGSVITYIDLLKEGGFVVDDKILDNFPHGTGIGTGTDADGWIQEAVVFWEKYINIEESA